MDKHRIAIRRSAENVWLNLFQSLLTFTIYLSLWVGIYQLTTNLVRLFFAKNKKVRLLLIIYWLFIFLLILTWLYSESILGFQVSFFDFLLPGIILSFFSCFIRFTEYKIVKKENLPFVIPYSEKEEYHNEVADNRQLFYGHVIVTLMSLTVFLSPILFSYLLIVDILLYPKTNRVETKKHLRSLGYLSLLLLIIGVCLYMSSIRKDHLYISVAAFVFIIGVYSTWIRYREYQNSKKIFNSLF